MFCAEHSNSRPPGPAGDHHEQHHLAHPPSALRRFWRRLERARPTRQWCPVGRFCDACATFGEVGEGQVSCYQGSFPFLCGSPAQLC